MEDQDIAEAKERVQALRKQVKAEQAERSAATADSAKEVRLASLTEEERHLEQQLDEVRATAMPGADPNAPFQRPPVVSVPVEEMTEGTAYVETVDVQGNLVRVRAEDVGTVEADAPPPDVPADATMTSREPRP
jgi:gamma-glutamyltranspeptidase